MTKKSSLVLAKIALAVLPLIAFLPLLSMRFNSYNVPQTCSAIGLSGNNSHPLNCGGTCSSSGWACKNKKGHDPDGKTYWYCTCNHGNKWANEPVCCHLIAKWDPDKKHYCLEVRGICTVGDGCAVSDGLTCQLINHQPLCAVPTPPPHF